MLPSALFLDFDGLICDTERAARRSWQELYAYFGFEFPPELWARMAGRSDGESVAIDDLAGRYGVKRESEWRDALSWRRDRKLQLADGEPALPGVARLVDAACEHRIPVGVVSSSPLWWVGRHLDRLSLRQQLSLLVTGEDAARHKPSPDLYLEAIRRSGAEPRNAVAFEDSPPGVHAALAAGLRCVAVAGSAGGRAGLAAADLVLDSLEVFDLRQSAVGGPGRAVR